MNPHIGIAAFRLIPDDYSDLALGCGFGWRVGESFLRMLLPNYEVEFSSICSPDDLTHKTISWFGIYIRVSRLCETSTLSDN